MAQRSDTAGVYLGPLPRRLFGLLPALLFLAACGVPFPTSLGQALLGAPTPTATPPAPITVGCEAAVPPAACARLQALAGQQPARFAVAADPAVADVVLSVGNPSSQSVDAGTWTYAVAAPFKTLDDEISLQDLLATWHGTPAGPFADHPILASDDTLRALSELWGPPTPGAVHTAPPDALLDEATRTGAWAILPFEELGLPWKTLRVDGISLLEKGLEANSDLSYPLDVPLTLTATRRPDALPELTQALGTLANRQETCMTVVAMTGVTALVRTTAHVMETRGLTYPARDIAGWLASADLTHISNEVCFTPDCPVPPVQYGLTFCSQARYIELLEAVGTDIVELTGNHLLDYGPEALYHTLEMYRERGWQWYGGGTNLAEATRPLLITHGPNRLAFLGCNAFGPSFSWASEDRPGSAPCDYEQMQAQIRELREASYLPIVTLQYEETYQYFPTAQQMIDFRALADAGAAVVQGSQAHQPQAIEIRGDAFIHYGLGNLFFDQMQTLGTRQEFINRLVFYDGRLLNVEMRTAMLEEYARPRPMTEQERRDLLSTIFGLSP